MRNSGNKSISHSQHQSQTLVLGSTKESCTKHPKWMQVQLCQVQVLRRKTYQVKPLGKLQVIFISDHLKEI